MNKFYELLAEACERMGRPVTVGTELVNYAAAAGFRNIHHRVYPLPLGPWAMDRRLVRADLTPHPYIGGD